MRWMMNRVFCIFLLFLVLYLHMDGKHASKANILVILGGIICFVFSRFSTSSSSISMLLFLLLSPDVLGLGLSCGWVTVTNVTAVKCSLNQVKCAQTTTRKDIFLSLALQHENGLGFIIILQCQSGWFIGKYFISNSMLCHEKFRIPTKKKRKRNINICAHPAFIWIVTNNNNSFDLH